jgi:hypothetical protein
MRACVLSVGLVWLAMEPSMAQSPSPPIDIWGHERIAWNQTASSPQEVSELSFYSYVDGYREPLEGVMCSPEPSGFRYECSARLPRMMPGPHDIYLVSAKGEVQSERSLGLAVNYRAHATGADFLGLSRSKSIVAGAEELNGLQAIASLPDGRLVLAEHSGRLLVVGSETHSPRLAVDLRSVSRGDDFVRLLAVAVPDDFNDSRAIFVAYTTKTGLRLARLTEANGILFNHAVIRENLNGSAPVASVAMAFGPDGLLYVAIPNRVLVIGRDGTAPRDRWSSALATGVDGPSGLAWATADGLMWLLGSRLGGGYELRAVRVGAGGTPIDVGSYDLSQFGGSAFAILRGTDGRARLLLAEKAQPNLRQWRVDSSGLVDELDQLSVAVGEITALQPAGSNAVWVATRTGVHKITLPR